MLERELKFRISEEESSDQIKDALERAGFQLTRSGALTHDDRYLDTGDWLLHRAGLSLRLRREGPDLRLEAKTLPAKKAEAMARIEWSQPAPDDEPPWSHLPEGDVQALLEPLAPFHVVSRLGVRARVASEREIFRWSRSDETLGSITLDHVARARRSGGDGGQGSYRELELELKEGAPDVLGDVRTALEDSLGVRPSADTKLALALEAAGVEVPELDESPFTPHTSDRLADVTVKNMGRQFARMVWYEPGARVGVDPEYIHDMRVATRRLRTALLVFSDVLPPGSHEVLQRELRWIGRWLGRVRDCDVELDRVRKMAAEAPDPERPALLIFANRVGIKRARRRGKLLRRLDSPRFLALKALARPWIEMRADSALVRDGDLPAYLAGPRIMAEWDRKMLEACRTAEQSPTAENVHALRIAIKHARYAVEYFSDLEGHGAKHRAKQLGRLQNVLGARQDAAILLRHMRRYAATIPEEDRELLLGARSAIEKIDRAARVKKSELQQVLNLGADQDLG